MKVIVIGLGSMGQRRIRLIKKIDANIEVCGVDTDKTRMADCTEKFGIPAYPSIDDALKVFNADCAVISTSPLSHGAIIKSCLEHGLNVFTELNLTANMYAENIALAKQKGLILFLSSTFLYRDEVKYIDKEIQSADGKKNYRYHVGQYLPDWHPWESYKNFFVGNKSTNGCRELFAIELPWIQKLFGEIESITVLSDKMTDLEIDYCDNYILNVLHKNGNKGSLCVDVVSRKAVRLLEVYGQQLYISWNGTPETLNVYDFAEKKDINVQLYDNVDQRSGYAAFVVENAYQNELEAYFNAVKAGKNDNYDMSDDLRTLELIDAIEEAANHGIVMAEK